MIKSNTPNPEGADKERAEMTDNLTADQLLALDDEAFERYFRYLVRAQLAHLHEYTEADTCMTAVHDLPAELNEPHGMHSDDGHDYLTAAIDLARELLDLHIDASTDDKRTWITNLVTADDNLDPDRNADPYYDSTLFSNYACDGICTALNDLLPDPNDN